MGVSENTIGLPAAPTLIRLECSALELCLYRAFVIQISGITIDIHISRSRICMYHVLPYNENRKLLVAFDTETHIYMYFLCSEGIQSTCYAPENTFTSCIFDVKTLNFLVGFERDE